MTEHRLGYQWDADADAAQHVMRRVPARVRQLLVAAELLRLLASLGARVGVRQADLAEHLKDSMASVASQTRAIQVWLGQHDEMDKVWVEIRRVVRQELQALLAPELALLAAADEVDDDEATASTDSEQSDDE